MKRESLVWKMHFCLYFELFESLVVYGINVISFLFLGLRGGRGFLNHFFHVRCHEMLI